MSTLSPRPPRPRRPNDRRGFEIAIICALTLEADAIEALFDHHWDDDGLPFDKELDDPNAYSTGMIGRFNVVLAYMPGMGKFNAATVAANCGKSFPGIKLALVVGICGVVPFGPTKDEIVLGDVIISNGVIQYDFGRQLPDRFVRKDTLLDVPGRSNLEIRGVLAKLKALRHRRQLCAKIADYLGVLRQDQDFHAEYPGVTKDRLFEASYRHTEDQKSCEQLGCNGELVLRSRSKTAGDRPTPAVHLGLMASGNSVMKSGEDRDRIAAQEGVIAFEMEGAGVWDSFPCIIIKGACDYADSHKSKVWQRYAAATAAACAKAFLSFWVPSSTQGLATKGHLSLENRDSFDQNRTAGAVDSYQTQPAFLVPFSKNDLFVGRDDILARLQGLLFHEGRRKAALVGLGGIGKTQIALQLAYWIKEKKQDYSVFWVPALSRASFEQACVQIMDACGIPTADNNNAVESVCQYLSSKGAGKWLLVVDNADDMQTVMGSKGADNGLYRSLPQSDQGQILFTTRYRKVAVSVAGRNILDVPAMDRDEARSYLEEALIQEISPTDDKVMKHLLTLLAHLPLAITQAAAYMNENQIPLIEYLQLLENIDRDRRELLSAEFQDDTRYEQSQDPVATTWFISFNQIRKADELASRILMFLAYVEPKAVPQSMLPEGESQQLSRAIGTLCGYRFLDRRVHSTVFDMHSLVHLAIRSWVAENDLEKKQSQAAIARLSEVFPTDKWENREVWRQYLPHAIKLLRCPEDDWSKELCELGYGVGRCLLIDGRVAEAVKLLEHVVAVQEKTLVESHPDRLASQHALAGAYRANGQIQEAVKLLEHVVAVQETTLAANHPSRLASQHALAGAYQANGQIQEALKLLEDVAAIREKTLVESHPDRLASQHTLAGAYQANGQIQEAVKLLEHVVAIREKTLVESHPDRLASQHALAAAYRANGQIQEAVKLLEHVVAIREKTLAEDHPSRLASQHALAGAYQANGQIEEAVKLLEHVVAIREITLAESHPDRLTSEKLLQHFYNFLDRPMNSTISAENAQDLASSWPSGSFNHIEWQWDFPAFFELRVASGAFNFRNEVILVIDDWEGYGSFREGGRCRAWACDEWLSECLPKNCRQVLSVLLDHLTTHVPKSDFGSFELRSDEVDFVWSTPRQLKWTYDRCSLRVHAEEMTMAEESIVKLIDIVGWLCRTMRPPNAEGRASFSSSCYTMQTHTLFGADTPLIALRDEPLWNTPHDCWRKLFGFCTVVAPPVVTKLWMPKTNQHTEAAFGRGLEMSFDLMVALAAVEFPLIISGGIIFAGYNTILVPTAVSTSGDAAQFHLITINDDEITRNKEITSGQLNPYIIDLGPRLLTNDIRPFRSMRCFLGWCEFAQVNLGTRHLPAQVQYSGCDEKGRSLVLDGYESLLQTGLGGGPLSVVLGLQANFKYTSHRCQFSPFGGFSKLLRDTALEVAAVYDTGSRRCWLVPKLSILLHMAHAYALSSADGAVTTIPFVEPHSDAAELINVLEPLGDRPIHGANNVGIIGDQSSNASSPGGFVLRQLMLGLNINLLSAVASTQRSSGRKLYGFEFMDVVTTPGRGTCMKTVSLYSTGRRWLDLVNEVDAIILCSGIGQIITPVAAESRQRPECNSLPKNLDYLAAMVPCLARLVCRRGGFLGTSPFNSNGDAPLPPLCRVKISKDSFWDLGGDPFSPCTHNVNSSETCWNRNDLLQRLVTGSFVRNMYAVIRPESSLSSVQTIPLSGAVTFGQVES